MEDWRVLSLSQVLIKFQLVTPFMLIERKFNIEYPLLFGGVGNRMAIVILFSVESSEYVCPQRLLFLLI